ncbi:PREDICTED: thyroid hormone receptor alpha-like, partial [Rhagoletis zephyria]|uniref:thyroid hormone receptor alpha-like n=1 Tax=Rhagoletis zephyria TaxID=28612 RepID=UPI000811528F
MSSIKCSVCGDDSRCGYNYSAISCVSCRTFFIRNSTRAEKLKCIKDNQCQIDVATRKCCSLCRYSKCISVGMKVKHSGSTHVDDQPTKDDQSSSALEFLHHQIDRLHISTTHQDNEKVVASQQTPMEVASGPKVQHRKRTYASSLGECERQLIYELQNAMSVFVDERTLPESRETCAIEDLINWPTVYARRIITFCKNLQSFKSMHSDSQLLILKAFYLPQLLIRAMFNYDVKREGYPVLE